MWQQYHFKSNGNSTSWNNFMTLWRGAYHIILCCWWQFLYRHLLRWQACLLTLCCSIIIIIITVVVIIIIIIIAFIILRNSNRSISMYSRFMEIPFLWSYVSVVISCILVDIFLLMYSTPQIFCVLKLHLYSLLMKS